jgi:hypothetical protein
MLRYYPVGFPLCSELLCVHSGSSRRALLPYTDQQPGLIVTVPYGLQHKPEFAVELQTDSQNLDFWSPSIEDVAAAQKALRKTLDKAFIDPSGVYTKGGYSDDEVQWQKIDIMEAGVNYDQYARQFAGVTLKGKRLILCNFINTQYSDTKIAPPATDFAFREVYAKGMHFIQAQYDPESQNILKVDFIGDWAVRPGAFVKVPTQKFSGYIIPKNYAEKNLDWFLGKQNDGFWQPTPDQAVTAYEAVIQYVSEEAKKDLQSPNNHSPFTGILAGIDKFHLQFVGIVSKGKKHVFCNFIYLEKPSAEMEHAMTAHLDLGVPDSGTSVWHASYDPETKTCDGYGDCGQA